MKKLQVLVPSFPKDDATSYTVPFIQQFLQAFVAKYAVTVEIVTLYFPQGDSFFWNGIKVIPLNGKHNANLVSKLIFLIRAFKSLKPSLMTNEYVGVLSFWYREAALLGNRISSKYNIKHYTWLQGQDVRKTNPYMKFLKPKTEQLIALSNFQNDQFYNDFGLRADRVAPVSINPNFFPPLNTGDRPIDILAIGSLIPLKNHQLFLDVVLELKKHLKTIKTVLIGNGPLEDTYKAFIRSNNLENNVTMTGLLTHQETMEYMNTAKIVLHPSTFEGGGMVYFEALYSGCHVISMLPVIKTDQIKFNHLTSKEAIISRIRTLLQSDELTFERVEEGSMNVCCALIYSLFFSE